MVRPEVTGRKVGSGRNKRAALPLDQRKAFTITEFCARHGFSRSHFFNLKQKGLGPREMDVGGVTLISIEAETEWRREREGGKATSRELAAHA